MRRVVPAALNGPVDLPALSRVSRLIRVACCQPARAQGALRAERHPLPQNIPPCCCLHNTENRDTEIADVRKRTSCSSSLSLRLVLRLSRTFWCSFNTRTHSTGSQSRAQMTIGPMVLMTSFV